jgi:RNA polymerase sigma factor (sigma-70 family)
VNHQQWVADAVSRFEKPLRVYVRSLLGSGNADQDIVQEAFLELCRQPREAVEAKLAPWLFTVCRRRVIDYLRKEQRMTTLTIDAPSRHHDPGNTLAEAEMLTLVLARLTTLPAQQQEVVRLKFLQQFSYREIAGVTGLSESHVGVLIHTAIKTLRQSFPQHTTEPNS